VTYQIGNDLPGPNGYSVTTVPLQANDLVWDPVRSRLYASVAASSGTSPGTVVAIDPTTASVTSTVSLGSEVDRLAISGNGQYLYAALQGSPTIRRLALPSLSEVAPGRPGTLAVSRSIAANAPQSMGTVIFDDAIARPTIAGINALGALNVLEYLQWGSTNGTLYSEGQSKIVTLGVNASGVTVTGSVTDGPAGKIHFYNGLLFTDAGSIFDTGTGQTIAQLSATNEVDRALAIDNGVSRIFRLSHNGGSYNYITIYDLASHVLLKTFAVIGPTLAFRTPAFVRWGTNGLAFTSANGTIVIIAGAYLTS
jgi:hypothetical protein